MHGSSKLWRLLIALALVASTFAVFFQTSSFGFVALDDYDYVVRNPHLRDGLSEASLLRAFEVYFGNWIPLTSLSLHLDFAAYGLEAGGYHVTNVILHSLSAVLLFLALSRMTGSVCLSGLVAAIFAIHPLHVESVAWIAERKGALSGVFWMLTLLAYARYCERSRSLGRYLVVFACFSLGLMSKPSVVTLPFVLLLLDYWPLGRLQRQGQDGFFGTRELKRALFEKLPMFLLAAGASVMTFSAQRSSGFVSELGSLPVGPRVANAVESYAIYLWQAVWPTGLAAFYPHPRESIASWGVAAAAVVLLTLTAVVLRAARTRPYAFVGWFWFLGTLVPMIGLVQVGSQARADRYTYIPLIGVSILVVWLVADFAKERSVDRRAIGAVAGAALLALGVAAWVQTATWRDTESLYRRAISATEDNYLAHNALGAELLLQRRIEEAEQHFQSAARIEPGWSQPQLGLGDVAIARGQNAKALRAYQGVLERNPEDPVTAGRYGLALGLLGRYREARPHLQRALASDEGNAELYRAMADIEGTLGNPRESVRYGRLALRLRPDDVDAANNLAWTLATCHDPAIRDPAEAIQWIEDIARDSNEPWLLDTLAAAYAAAGQFELAISTARRAASGAKARDRQAILERLSLYSEGRPYVAPNP